MAIRYSFSPRPSSQSCSLVSHCTNSPNRLPPRPPACTCLTFSFFPRHSFAASSIAAPSLCCRRCRVSPAGTPPPTSARTPRTPPPRGSSPPLLALSSILRFDGFPRSPWTTALSPRFFNAFSSRFTCRTLNPNSSAASRCVISFFLAFFNATSRSLSACVISSCPSCIPKAWGCQGDISTLLKGDIITLPEQVGSFCIPCVDVPYRVRYTIRGMGMKIPPEVRAAMTEIARKFGRQGGKRLRRT